MSAESCKNMSDATLILSNEIYYSYNDSSIIKKVVSITSTIIQDKERGVPCM